MLDFFTPNDDAIMILKSDHETVKKLFEDFENAESLRDKKRIAAEAIMELKIHAEIEEKIFYPTVRQEVGKEIMNEADEEHHVAKLLIAELEQMDGSEDHWEAKFTVLAENIRHHIKEEEGDMLPKARRVDVDFVTLGQKLLAMKHQLKRNGVPTCDEERLMAMSKTLADSPAKAARAKTAIKQKAVKVRVKKAAAKLAKPASPRKAATKKAPARNNKTPKSASAKRR